MSAGSGGPREALVVVSGAVGANVIRIPGATAGGVEAELLNVDPERGLVATIVRILPGASIPAHFHRNGPEAHFVLEGDLINAGETLGPGAYLTHAAGVAHGPHSSERGCRVLTIEAGAVATDGTDFHIVEAAPAADASGLPRGEGEAIPERDAAVPPDMALEPIPDDALLESQKTAPTPDNPTNPSTT